MKNKEVGESSNGSVGHRIGLGKIKLEIPQFDGSNPRSWVRKCLRYFQVYDVSLDWRVEVATLFKGEKADVWYQG